MRAAPKFLKKGYIILKILTESGNLPKVIDHDNNRTVKKYVTSYHLKTCFLHELELSKQEVENTRKITDPQDKRKLALVWAKRIVDHYEKSIERRFLATFFEPDKNLFGLVGLEDVMRDHDIFIEMVKLLQYLLGSVGQEGAV